MKCTAAKGYLGTIYIVAEDGRSAYFQPGRRTLTGARHRNGQCMCLTAAEVRRYLKLDQLRNVRDSMELEDDKHIFDELSAIDVDMHAKRCYNTVSLPLSVLRGAVHLSRKG